MKLTHPQNVLKITGNLNMSNDLVKRLREKAFRTETYELFNSAADRIEDLEEALFNIYAAPNDIPFIKAQIDAVLDINEYRQALEGKDD